MVLEVEGGLYPGTRVIVNESALSNDEDSPRKKKQFRSMEDENDIDNENMELFNGEP